MIMTNAKAYVALIGAIATALLGVYAADTPVGHWLTIVSVVATAVGTWAVPNQPAAPSTVDWFNHEDERGEVDIVLLLLFWTVVVVTLLLFGVRL